MKEFTAELLDLEDQRNGLEHLKARSGLLKKGIAQQASLNLSFDRKLSSVCSSHFGPEGVAAPSLSVPDELSRIKASSSSATLPNQDDLVIKPVRDRLDVDVQALVSSLKSISGCWIEQTAALIESSNATLLRIVPSSLSVQYDNSSSSTAQEQYLPRGRFSLSDHLECAAGTAFALPMPPEDFTSCQASNASTMVTTNF